MTWGIKIKSSTGVTTFDSGTRKCVFMSGEMDTSNSVSTGVPSGFSSAFSFATTTERPQWSAPQGTSTRYITAPGTSDGSNGIYYELPAYHDSGYNQSIISKVVSGLPMTVYTFGEKVPPSSGFGFSASNNYGLSVIDQTYRSLHVQQNSSGECLFSSIAYGVPAFSGGGGAPPSAYSLPAIDPNITFPAPLDKPPLIFITTSDGWISFYGFVKNEAGQYIGAVIVTQKGFGQVPNGSYNFYYPSVELSPANFTYFIVSEDTPSAYSPDTDHGMIVRNADGAIVFDSRYLHAWVDKNSGASPKVSVSFNGAIQVNYTGASIVAYGTIGMPNGVCINNFNAVTAMSSIPSIAIPGQGFNLAGDSVTFYGQYIRAGDGYAMASMAATAGVTAVGYLNAYECCNFTSETQKTFLIGYYR